jgi:hypothetical protein
MKAAVVALCAIVGFPALCEGKETTLLEQRTVQAHQRCVVRAVYSEAKNAKAFDPRLLERGLEQCEPGLQGLHREIAQRTNNPELADRVLEQVRHASKRGLSVVLTAYFSQAK